MDSEQGFLQALHDDPHDDAAWLVLADWLEERRDPRAELVRLQQFLRQAAHDAGRLRHEERLRHLLAAGVQPLTPVLTNSLGMSLALIPSGVFRMGSPDDEPERDEDEGPVHEVEISRPFYLGVYPVTQDEYQRIMGANPSSFRSRRRGRTSSARLPVDSVLWQEAVAFCKKLSARKAEKEAGRVYRLPTEAEWEYACRAGTTTPFFCGPTLSSTQANCDGGDPYAGMEPGPRLMRPTPVGSYPPNPFGLYDMHGNVVEWCADWYSGRYYARSPRTDPPGPRSGQRRVLRGGSYGLGALYCRSACRDNLGPRFRNAIVGFRVALTVPNRTRGGS